VSVFRKKRQLARVCESGILVASLFIREPSWGPVALLRQGVTIGVRVDDGPVPVLGDHVDLGAYAQILGGVRIGHHAKIGAMSVVLCDVPDGATAVEIRHG
jgi:serine acetyltransferase